MSQTSFFGYGSLVNLNTHNYPNPRRATVTGWRRIWRSIDGGNHAYLSVRPDPVTTLKGVIADVPDGDWTALDLREAGYTRQPLSTTTVIYEVQAGVVWPRDPHPILRSYLDVVVHGYATHFGEEGVADFFTTTDNWGPILDDRADPLYPRYIPVPKRIANLVDSHLTAVVK